MEKNIWKQFKQEEQLKRDFCEQNKISKTYYRQKDNIIVDFSTIDNFVNTYPTKLTAKDIITIKDKIAISPHLIEKIYYNEIVTKIKKSLSPAVKKVFKLMLQEFSQKEIAQKLNITSRTVRHHVKIIREKTKKVLKRLS